jgi:hypothetical protein
MHQVEPQATQHIKDAHTIISAMELPLIEHISVIHIIRF